MCLKAPFLQIRVLEKETRHFITVSFSHYTREKLSITDRRTAVGHHSKDHYFIHAVQTSDTRTRGQLWPTFEPSAVFQTGNYNMRLL